MRSRHARARRAAGAPLPREPGARLERGTHRARRAREKLRQPHRRPRPARPCGAEAEPAPAGAPAARQSLVRSPLSPYQYGPGRAGPGPGDAGTAAAGQLLRLAGLRASNGPRMPQPAVAPVAGKRPPALGRNGPVAACCPCASPLSTPQSNLRAAYAATVRRTAPALRMLIRASSGPHPRRFNTVQASSDIIRLGAERSLLNLSKNL